MLMTPVAAATATPTWRATIARVLGMRATSSAPTAGRAMRLVSTGNPASTACAVSAASTALTVPPVLRPLSHRSRRERTKERSQGGPRDEEGQQEDGAGGDAEGVVADEAGLDDAEAGAAGPHDGGHTVDEAVDAPLVEGGGTLGHRLDRA